MDEYIKRAEALQQCGRFGDYTAWSIWDGIGSIPAADVGPVVRCKDCKYSCKDGNGRSCEGYWYELSEYDVTVKDDDFCSYGERKDGGRDG